MEANFDIIISGCNTRCRHCYVNGGPGALMRLEDALLCIEKLDAIAALLPFDSSFTLDNEPINHPDIAGIIRAAASAKHAKHFHHGMTTGLALMRRNDRDEVVRAYLDNGCTEFGITLHGSPEHHDELVRRRGAHKASLEAAKFLKSCGAEISVSLMFNRFFPGDAESIDRDIDSIGPDYIWFAVPNYTPHANMPAFEPYRGTLYDLYAIKGFLARWKQDPDELLRSAGEHTPAAAAALLDKGVSIKELYSQEQNEMYLTVHQDCMLYMGNTGVETRCLGDLRTLDIEWAADEISHSPGNRDWEAFYDEELLPEDADVIRALNSLPRDIAFSDMPSVFYRALEELRVPTRIL